MGIWLSRTTSRRKRFQEGVKITQEEADELFDIDLNRAAAGADELILKKIGSHDDLPQSIQEVLVEMVFQLGLQVSNSSVTCGLV